MALLVVTTGAASAWADGGTVRLVEARGDYEISVFTAPNPLRAGPVDISVMLLDTATGQPAGDARVELVLSNAKQPDMTIHAVATTEAATNKLLKSALFALPEPGEWHVQVTCDLPEGAIEARFAMSAAPAQAAWLSEWTWFTWPVVGVLLFGVHRYLVARRQRATARAAAASAVS